MGEIGLDRREYLYDLTYCDIVLIGRGYDRRCRQMWSSARWATFMLMASFQGGDMMAKNGFHSPKDLIQFPWERKTVIITEDEQKALMREIEAFNKAKKKSKPQP